MSKKLLYDVVNLLMSMLLLSIFAACGGGGGSDGNAGNNNLSPAGDITGTWDVMSLTSGDAGFGTVIINMDDDGTLTGTADGVAFSGYLSEYSLNITYIDTDDSITIYSTAISEGMDEMTGQWERTTAWGSKSSGTLWGRRGNDAAIGNNLMATDMDMAGDLVYLISEAGLSIVNVTDTASPALMGRADTPSRAKDIKVSGSHAYIADYRGGLLVMDVSDPSHPRAVASAKTSAYAYGVDVSGSYAYVADSYSGLFIFDISNPQKPVLKGSTGLTGSHANDVRVSGQYAYVVDTSYGLIAVDVSDPASPVEVDYYDPGSSYEKVDIKGDIAYVTSMYGIALVDISNPLGLSGLGSIGGSYGPIRIVGDKLYAGGTGGVFVANITVPESPEVQGGIYSVSGVGDVTASGSLVAYTDGLGDLRLYTMPEVAQPGSLFYETDGFMDPQYVIADGTYAFIFDLFGDPVQIVNMAAPGGPELVSTYSAGYAHDYPVLDGDLIYMLDSSGLSIINASDKTTLEAMGSYAMGDYYMMQASGGYAFVANGSGMEVVDISDPGNPAHAGGYATGLTGAYHRVALDGDIAYVYATVNVLDEEFGNYKDITKLYIANVTDPTSPAHMAGPVDLPDIRRMAVSGGYAFALTYDALDIYDLSDPGAIARAAEIPLNYPRRIVISGQYAYVADYNEMVVMVDISDPEDPWVVYSFASDWPKDLYIAGSLLYIVEGDFTEGVREIDLSGLLAATIERPVEFSPAGACAATAVQSEGGLLYVACAGIQDLESGTVSGADIRIYNTTVPGDPVLVAEIAAPNFYGNLVAEGDLLYYSAHTPGGYKLVAVDKSDPSNPVEAGWHNSGDYLIHTLRV